MQWAGAFHNRKEVHGQDGRRQDQGVQQIAAARSTSAPSRAAPTPAGNLALRGLIRRAKKDQVPSRDRQGHRQGQRRGRRRLLARHATKHFGPGSCMVIVDCLTDNLTVPSATFAPASKAKSKLGTPGSVSHLFDHCAISYPARNGKHAGALMEGFDVDVTDIENGMARITVFAPHTEVRQAKQALLDTFGELEFESTKSSSCRRP
ncbi:YebC/PmpR family DNA-binding transcriptional regulator [Billgrantia gudaonensis]|uniref:YebC/PmpR family DNA-binding transcriptional regulator n=1 Tax=Billgrantia gudaonensis TaxID=376427 RepID=A0A432JJR5_9GAMM|nr:YebC/PmpR family DNA-binding transcriptional regulator [Halomonas gudaonensis]